MSYIKHIRKKVSSTRIFIPGVRAVILNRRMEILFQRRKDMPLWGLPGGAVEPDETAYEALVREVKEETDLDVLEAEPFALYSGPKQRFEYADGDKVQCFALAFIIKKWEGNPIPDGNEGTLLTFFSRKNIPDEIMPVHKPTIEDFFSYEGSFILSS